MANDLPTLLDQIDALLDAPGEGSPGLETIERTLTDGYAYALSIERERAQLERELGATAVRLNAEAGLQAVRLSEVARRLEAANNELSGLRAKLAALRAHASAARAASV